MTLASYAATEATSSGRQHTEEVPSFRSQYQRDRDRIVHSAAFRRLEYKTQVFVNHEGDMFRTRLTHSIEVAQIGRSIARSLSLNEDLTEAICLAHDLGHTPFGHAGQDALNGCMKAYGGFEHNLQSLRVIDQLEEKYAEFRGLNLMFETREGILKHCSNQNAKKLGELGRRFLDKKQPGLEAQIANVADEIAYNNHDVDDGLRSGLISIEQLLQCNIFKQHHDMVTGKWQDLTERQLRHEIVRRMINSQVSDLITNSQDCIAQHAPQSIADVREAGDIMIRMSDAMQERHFELKRFLRKNLYNHFQVKRMTHKAAKVIEVMFGIFNNDPAMLPDEFQGRIQNDDPDENTQRVIADYIAGMTDRFAIAEHDRLCDPNANSY